VPSDVLRFDWQGTQDEFLKWLLPSLLAQHLNAESIDELSRLTNKFTDISVTMQVNGVSVDPTHMFESIQQTMDYSVSAAARDLLTACDADVLYDGLKQLNARVRRIIEERAAQLGVELDLEEPL
jgi:hypothetical protein